MSRASSVFVRVIPPAARHAHERGGGDDVDIGQGT